VTICNVACPTHMALNSSFGSVVSAKLDKGHLIKSQKRPLASDLLQVAHMLLELTDTQKRTLQKQHLYG